MRLDVVDESMGGDLDGGVGGVVVCKVDVAVSDFAVVAGAAVGAEVVKEG